jgi:hypothetical protein
MKLTQAETRFLANLFTNISAGWFGVIIITPNFADLTRFEDVAVLIFNIISAILFSGFAIRMEEKLK